MSAQCTIVHTPGNATISVHSPYSRAFAWEARNAGGTWDRDAKVWRFSNFQIETVRHLCTPHYTEIVVADAIPAPVVPEAIPDHGHVGTVGATLTVSVIVEKALDFNGAYGETRLHIMRDDAGHVFTWYASSARYDAGQRLTLQGKVKKHDTYKGVSQTCLTRCKKL